MAPAPIISSFVIVDFQLLASTEIWIPSTVSIFTSIVEIFAVLFEINHAYVDPINITVIINSTNNITLLNKEMKIVCNMNNANIEKKENYVVIYSKDDMKYFDYSGNEISYKNLYPNNKLYAKKINGKWGFIDKADKLIIQNEYEMVTEFNNYGFAGIKKDGKWGVVNSEGTIIQEPIYELKWENPSFIGKYYKVQAWGEQYYSSQIEP